METSTSANDMAATAVHHLPSVGTWLAAIPFKTEASNPAVFKGTSGISCPAAYRQPSVGTWLAATPFKMETPTSANDTATPFKMETPFSANDKAATTNASPAVESSLMPSVGTWLVQRRHDGVGPSTQALTCSAVKVTSKGCDFQGLPASAWQAMHAKFQSFTRVKLAAAVPQAVQATTPAAVDPVGAMPGAGIPPAFQRPSVGTWLAPVPFKVVGCEHKPKPWYHETPRPSQSAETCKNMRAIIQERDLELEQLKARIRALEAGEPDPIAVAAAKDLEDLRKEAFGVLQEASSNGKLDGLLEGATAGSVSQTGMAPQDAGPKPTFRLMASVGTWIAKKPVVGVPPAPCPPKNILECPSHELKNMDHSELIDMFKAELKRRDEEIEHLRGKIGLLAQ
jgi:hypothetical protein